MLGRPVEHVQFDGSDVAQARALGAAHGENWHTVIVGTDVAAQLVGDYLARSVKELRKRAREERKLARSSQVSERVGLARAQPTARPGSPAPGTAPRSIRKRLVARSGRPSGRRARTRPGST